MASPQQCDLNVMALLPKSEADGRATSKRSTMHRMHALTRGDHIHGRSTGNTELWDNAARVSLLLALMRELRHEVAGALNFESASLHWDMKKRWRGGLGYHARGEIDPGGAKAHLHGVLQRAQIRLPAVSMRSYIDDNIQYMQGTRRSIVGSLPRAAASLRQDAQSLGRAISSKSAAAAPCAPLAKVFSAHLEEEGVEIQFRLTAN
eukprot:1591081-Pyramimonas_sp.AAC.1